MEVVRENIGNLNEIIKITIAAADYAEVVDKTLKMHKKKATVPGFRQGMVPMSIIKKMYLKGTTADETYKMASQACYNYLTDNKIEILGDPLPSDSQPALNFESQGDLEFHFEVGVSPEVVLDLENTKVIKYNITVEDEMVDGFTRNFFQRFGKLVDVESIQKDEAITGTLTQGEIEIKEAYVGLISMTDEERAPFIGKKVGDKMEVNVNEIYKTASQKTAILKMTEEQIAELNPIFELTFDQVRKFEIPEITDELVVEGFPNGEVKTVAEFNKHANAEVHASLENESKYKLAIDVRKKLMEDANLSLPETFLKKWIFAMNDGKYSKEDIDGEYPQFVEMMSWDIIKKKFVLENDMQVTKEELIDEAKQMAKQQFIQYGMPTIEDSLLSNYANQIISNKEEARKLYDAIYERKVVEFVASKIKTSKKKISAEDFGKLFQ